MMNRKEAANAAYESLLAQLEFVPAERLPAVGSSDLLLKSLDQGYLVLAESVFKQIQSASEDLYLFGYYCSRMDLGDSFFITSAKKSTRPKEREIGRLIYNRIIELREVRNAGKRSKCMVLKNQEGYDALCGTGTTIRPARVMLAKDDAIHELVKRYSQQGNIEPFEEPETQENTGIMGFLNKKEDAPEKKEIISIEKDY